MLYKYGKRVRSIWERFYFLFSFLYFGGVFHSLVGFEMVIANSEHVLNLLLTKLARDRTGRISVLGLFCTDLAALGLYCQDLEPILLG